MKIASLLLTAFCFLAALPAGSQVVYENGPIDGTTTAWTINEGYFVDDSFNVSTPSAQVSGISFGAWMTPGDTLRSVEVSITSQPDFGTVYFDQVVNFTQSGCTLNSYNYNVCTETGMFSPVTLNSGMYFVNLLDAVSQEGNPVYWDENSGVGCHSQGCPSQAYDNAFWEPMPSEAFTMLGAGGTGTTPEPSSFLLFGSGALGLGAAIRRKMKS